jgi:hypothetical protein
MAHCRRARLEAVATHAPQIEHNPSITPEQAAKNLEKLNSAVVGVKRGEPSAEWAFRLVMRGKTQSGLPLPAGVAKCATDAITSSAGRKVVETCADPELKAEYAAMRETIIDNYRMRGQKLWETP